MSAEAIQKPLRLWPGIVAAGIMLPVRFVLPLVWPDGLIFAVAASFVCAFLILVWWMFLSRAPLGERFGGLALMILALAGTWAVADVSLSTGAMGMLVPMLGLPIVALALVVGAVATRGRANGPRRLALAAAIALACAPLLLVRTDGMTSTSTLMGVDFSWRWTPTAEERLLASATPMPLAAPTSAAPVAAPSPVPAPEAPAGAATTPAARESESAAVGEGAVRSEPAHPSSVARIEWPGFRGAARDSVIRGVAIETDWTASPPRPLWRRPIGPGWSSFAVSGDLFYTQEQRGEEEIVACYRMSTGEPVWTHRNRVRFWESNGGAGPRATPTLDRGRVYAFGATGILDALDAATGSLVWSRQVSSDSQIPVPGWGFSSSPLVSGEVVIVAAAGKLVAYDRITGAPRWSGADAGPGYSSPHLVTLSGVPQVVLLTARGASSYAPADGARLC